MPPALLVLAAVLAGCALAGPQTTRVVPAGPSVAESAAAESPSAESPSAVPSADSSASPVPASSRQMLVVTTPEWSATSGRMQRYERTASGWQAVGAPVEVAVGRNGLGWGRGLHEGSDARPGSPGKHEGDGRAPAGVFRLTAAFGYGASEPTGLPYVPTDADVECVDDTTSVAYNTVRERTAGADWGSHEEMRRGDGLYRIGVVVAHNGPGVDGALVPGGGPAASPAGGSCIFLHVWRGPGSTTAGCTAMPDASLQDVLAWLDADAEPVLVQLPRAERDRLRPAWALP